jgi:FtsP/CotA-like multicopper oxidase with cupredoxin domain
MSTFITTITFAQMGDEIPVPHYFGPYPNYATSQLPTLNPDGTVTGGIRKFIDSLPGLGPAGANNLGQYISVAVPDTTTYPGADYYEIAVVEYYQQMHSDLTPSRLRGYVQLDTSVIPGAGVPLTNLNGTSATPILMPNGAQAVGVDIPRYLGPFILAEKDRPVRVKFYNLLPTGTGGDLFLPVDTTVMGSGMGPIEMPGMPGMFYEYTQNRATLHLHGGRNIWISDGTTHQWITPAGENTVYPKGVSVYNVPDMPDPGPGASTFYYTNQQSARLMFYHDHSYGITRLNVYAGEAAGYLLTDQIEQALVAAGIIPVEQIPLVIQDKTFVPDNTVPITNVWGTFASQLAFQDPTWNVAKWGGPGSLWYPHVYMQLENPGDPSGWNPFGRWAYGPWFWPPTTGIPYGPVPNPYYTGGTPNQYGIIEPYWNPGVPSISTPGEAWFDTPVVNGQVYPYVEVQPQSYRLRILNAADDRFWNLQLHVATSGIVNSITVANGGSGYTRAPLVTVTDTTGQGYGATAEATIDPVTGAVTAIDMLTVGSGFTATSNVVVTIGPPPIGGTQATATATVYTAPTEVGMVPAIPATGLPADWPTDSRPGGLPDPAYIGPSMIQIGNEGGFLPAPYVVPNRPVGWNLDPGTFDFGIVNQWALGLAPAERADVIVDFSAFAGKTIILYNDAPAPVPANDPRQNYYTSDPDQVDSGGAPSTLPGYGPNTRTIMQIRVANTAPAAPYDMAPLEAAFASTATTEGAFAASQETIIVPQAAYSSAYNTTFPDVWSNIFDNSLTFTPIGANTSVTIPFQAKALHDEMGETYDDYGRMQAVMGLEMPRTQAGLQNFILYNMPDPPTEAMKFSVVGTQIGTLGDGTQIWKITHNGVDTHPIHFHEFEVQLINRVAWDNNIRWPDPNELGWKETVKFNPLQDTIVALRPVEPVVPFDLPNSIRLLDPTKPEGAVIKSFTQWEAGMPGIRPGFDTIGEPIDIYNHYVNFGWEYTWHCHILAHEEMDMMRPIAVAFPPRAPSYLVAFKQGTRATLMWTDNSLSETGFTIQRANDANFATGVVTFTVGANVKTYVDTTIRNNRNYYYRVQANNLVGDTWDYANPNINEGAAGFPTIQADSAWTNTAMVGTGTPPAAPSNLVATAVTRNNVTLAWTDNSNNEDGFLIQRAANSGFSQNVVYIAVGVNVNTYTDTTVAPDTRYYYRVLAFSGTGNSAWSNSINIRTLV